MPPFPPLELSDLIMFGSGVMAGFFIALIAKPKVSS